VSWSPNEDLVVEANEEYWDGAPSIKNVRMTTIVEQATRVAALRAGDVHVAKDMPPEELDAINETTRSRAVRAVSNRVPFYFMPTDLAPFDNPLVRQAINYAANVDGVIEAIVLGNANRVATVLGPWIFGADPTLEPYPHDPAKARALLAEAGYPNGFDVDYVVMADDEAERVAASLQSDLAAVGVRVHIVQLSYATYATAIASSHGPAFSKIGWVADFPDPTTFLDAKFHSRSISDENSSNDSFYANPELDALLDAARVEPDLTRRDELYRRAERILYDDAPWIWDYHQMMTEVVQPYVAGYAPHPVWMRDYTSTWLDVTDAGPVPR
jgi:peptide/nickel transport system substrate-binding protein